MKTFLKAGEVELRDGGYLYGKDQPVTNAAFVQAQIDAEYVVTFAEMAKGRKFKAEEVEDLDAFKAEVHDKLYGERAVEYVSAGEAPKQKIGDQLKKEALAFLDFKEKEATTEQINGFLQKFNTIREFETHGLFFDQGIVKLNKIYTIEDVTRAVTEVIDLVD